MKYIINQMADGEDELILNYREVNEEVERILAFMEQGSRRILGWRENEQVVIAPGDLLYAESVEGKTFAYTEQEVYRMNYTLQQLEVLLQKEYFFRCSKSMIMNINKVAALRSLSSNRIDATMENGEHIIISRTYASDFRKKLRGE
ncbi:MAG: LytTR family transcriptional regulator DNA-binding domain-containing protein [Lachnospiraceae bacterium]|nr:LytTR family transcriptional regulator DNA-binding domain-containing protein [Lachnospiraceae bacterium]MBR6664904.1 LytTR family transcriptional regulator DNA-binding domain-containing protein [Lachnospiraceae bacterium]